MMQRIRSPKHEPRDRDMGPALARLANFDLMRRRLDVALSVVRVRPSPVYLEQP